MTSYVQEFGEIYDNQLRKLAEDNNTTVEDVIARGLDDATAGQTSALIAGALDRAGLEMVFKRFGKDALKNLLKTGSKIQAAKVICINGLKAATTEGLTEGGQYVVEEVGSSLAAGRDLQQGLADLDGKQFVESLAAGFTSGGYR